MVDETDETPWPPALWAKQFQDAGEATMRQQAELMRSLLGASPTDGFPGAGGLGAMGRSMATFKTRVQSGGRISIPDAEREALDIEEGDIVQTVVVPIKRNRSDSE